MHNLEKMLRDNEEWLMRSILGYAQEHGYTKYTSSHVEAWRLSISGLTDAIARGLEAWPSIPEFDSEDIYVNDPIAAFGVLEAKRHRQRGVSYPLFVGLFKYYRQTYHDLLSEQDLPEQDVAAYQKFLLRCFDRIEIAFSKEWIELSGDVQIEELRRTNREVVNKKNVLLTLLESLDNPIACFDEQLQCTFANTSFLKLIDPVYSQGDLYFSKEDAGRDEKYEHLLPKVLWAKEIVRTLQTSGESTLSQTFSLEQDQHTRFFEVYSSRLLAYSRGSNGFVLILNDVTLLREAAQKARENEKRIETLLEAIPLPMVVTSAATEKSLYANRRMSELMGLPYETIVGTRGRDFYVDPDSRPMVIETLERQGHIHGVELQLRRVSGETFWVQFSGVITTYQEERAYLFILQDITDRMKAREERRKLLHAVDGSPASVIITDASGIIEYVNKKCCDISGYSKEEILGNSPSMFKSSRQGDEEYKNLWKQISSGRDWSGELCNRNKNGEEYWEAVSISPIFDDAGVITHYIALKEDITERRVAERALRKSEKRFRTLIQGLQTGVVVHAPDTSIELCNPKAAELLGLPMERLLRAGADDQAWHFIAEDGRILDREEYPVMRMLRGNDGLNGQVLGIVQHETSNTVWVRVDAFREYRTNGSLKSIVVHFWDMTTLKLTADALKKSEEQARLVFEAANVGLCLFSTTGQFLRVNKQMEKMFGYAASELGQMHLNDITFGEDLEISAKYARRALAGNLDSFDFESRYLNKDGTVLNCLVSSTVKRDEQGHAEFFIGYFMDITVRKSIENALLESRERLSEAQRIARVGNWALDVQSGIYFWSPEMHRLYETTPQSFSPVQETVLDFVHPDDRQMVLNAQKQACDSLGSMNIEHRIVLHGGTEKILHCLAEAFDSGGVVSLRGTAQDITDRKVYERALRENEQFQRLLLRSIGAGVITVRPEGLIVESMNARAKELIGERAESIIGQSINELCWQNMDGHCSLGLPTMDENPVEEFILMRPDGKRIPVLRTSVFADVRGEPRYVLVMFDITERKALERQLNLAQKLEAIGSLAAGIAHEINTPVQYISSNISYLEKTIESIIQNLRQCEEQNTCLCSSSVEQQGETLGSNCAIRTSIAKALEEVPEAIRDSQEGISRVSEIVLSMRKFSHPDAEEPHPVDLNAAIQNTVTISRNEWKYVAEVEMDLADELPPVRCTSGDCNQVLLNVIVNAAHAVGEAVESSGDKGVIAISTRCNGAYVETRIRDTGCGIPPENQSKIFDPFFTTKEVGRGTGQGLAITHSILERYSGLITYETEVGKGTEFLIKLPVFQV